MDPKYEYTEAIVAYLQEISKMEGELHGMSYSFENEEELHSRASIEAIHYSTKIEGNPLTLEQVTSALVQKKRTTANQNVIKEVINYSKARARIADQCRKKSILSIKFILELHEILLDGIVRGKIKGHFREAQNVVKDSKTKKIVYFPPEWTDIKKLMKQLVSWTNQSLISGKSPLIVSAILHYQFVTIHPFMDGNGRLARLLSNYILLSNSYEISKYAALEKQHEKNRTAYYRSLRKVQAPTYYEISKQIRLDSWIQYWLECLKKTYLEGLDRVRNVSLSENTDDTLSPRLRSALGFFRKHTKLKASDYESIMGVGRTQAVHDLKKLVEFGYIKRVGGGRSTVYKVVSAKK